MSTTRPVAPARLVAAHAVLPPPKPTAAPRPQQPPFRVLQTRHAPAQRSLFLRTGL